MSTVYYSIDWNDGEPAPSILDSLDEPYTDLDAAKASCCRDHALVVKMSPDGRMEIICEGEYEPDADEMIWSCTGQ